jgi:SsrA-binding protein|tara:strand:- start:7138 stop:7590 length:453 start_codon:yes stop_codon:yes gene_type:complete
MSAIINIKNRKASYSYQLIDKYTAGIVLLGTEIKSIRNNQANISDAHCIYIDNEMWVKNLHIDEYSNSGYKNHEPKRARKLLLNKIELSKIEAKVNEKGMSVIPLRLFSNEKGKIKLEISLAKGKKNFDKRESIKEKDIKRDIQRLTKLK